MRRALEHLPAAVRAHGHVGVQDPCSWSLGGRGDRLGGRCHDRRSGCCGPRLQQGRLSAARGRIPVHTEVYFPFLDEAPEFSGRALEALRTPLETGEVTIARSSSHVRYPARFQLVLAANPCPCGMSGVAGGACTCTPMNVRRYNERLSGPVLDRIDIHHRMLPSTRVLSQTTAGEASSVVAARVLEARDRQRRRLTGTAWSTNGEVPGFHLRGLPSPVSMTLVDDAVRSGRLSARGVDKVVRISWTLADLQGRDRPSRIDLAAALGLRQDSWRSAA